MLPNPRTICVEFQFFLGLLKTRKSRPTLMHHWELASCNVDPKDSLYYGKQLCHNPICETILLATYLFHGLLDDTFLTAKNLVSSHWVLACWRAFSLQWRHILVPHPFRQYFLVSDVHFRLCHKSGLRCVPVTPVSSLLGLKPLPASSILSLL